MPIWKRATLTIRDLLFSEKAPEFSKNM